MPKVNIMSEQTNDLIAINKLDYQSDRQSLVAQTERAQMKIEYLESDIKTLQKTTEALRQRTITLRARMLDSEDIARELELYKAQHLIFQFALKEIILQQHSKFAFESTQHIAQKAWNEAAMLNEESKL